MQRYTTHDLKLGTNFCDAVYEGRKSFEIRRNDRGYQTGDHVRFIPFRSDAKEEENKFPQHPIMEQEYEITYILSGWGIENGYIGFAIQRV